MSEIAIIIIFASKPKIISTKNDQKNINKNNFKNSFSINIYLKNNYNSLSYVLSIIFYIYRRLADLFATNRQAFVNIMML